MPPRKARPARPKSDTGSRKHIPRCFVCFRQIAWGLIDTTNGPAHQACAYPPDNNAN